MKDVVSEAVKPLAAEVDRLAKEIRGKEAAAEVIEQTTMKGSLYEGEIVGELQRKWAQVAGAEVEHVGGDNQPGDILIKIPSSTSSPSTTASDGIVIAIEVRDRQEPLGRKAISDALTEVMAQRQATAAIYLSRTSEGLAKEIGEWGEGQLERGQWVATTHEHLVTAVRFLIVQKQLEVVRSSQQEINPVSLKGQLERIRTTLSRIATINRKLSDIRESTDSIEVEADSLKSEIRDALTGIEEAIRTTTSMPSHALPSTTLQ